MSGRGRSCSHCWSVWCDDSRYELCTACGAQRSVVSEPVKSLPFAAPRGRCPHIYKHWEGHDSRLEICVTCKAVRVVGSLAEPFTAVPVQMSMFGEDK